MAKLWELLSERGKANWAELYEQFMGIPWEKASSDDRAIHCEPKLESLEEIDKLMRQKPSGRMGRG
jgi:hypothetical protein